MMMMMTDEKGIEIEAKIQSLIKISQVKVNIVATEMEWCETFSVCIKSFYYFIQQQKMKLKGSNKV